MIQRVQSLYLLGGIASLVLILVLEFTKISCLNTLNNYFLMAKGLVGICIVLTLISVFLYKKRTKQMMINNLTAFGVFILVCVSLMYTQFLIKKEIDIDCSGTMKQLSFNEVYNFPVLLLGICFLIFIFLANRAIKKDEKLVRSYDRIR